MDLREAYTTLEVPYGSPLEGIEPAFNKLVRVWHPDRFAHAPDLVAEANRKVAQLNEAREVLREYWNSSTSNEPEQPIAPTSTAPEWVPSPPTTALSRRVRTDPTPSIVMVGAVLLMGLFALALLFPSKPPPNIRAHIRGTPTLVLPAVHSPAPVELVEVNALQPAVVGHWLLPLGDVISVEQAGENRFRLKLIAAEVLKSCEGWLTSDPGNRSWSGYITFRHRYDPSLSNRASRFEILGVEGVTATARTEIIKWSDTGSEVSRTDTLIVLERTER